MADARPPRRRLLHVRALQYWRTQLPLDVIALQERGETLEFFVRVKQTVSVGAPVEESILDTVAHSLHCNGQSAEFVTAGAGSVCAEFSLREQQRGLQASGPRVTLMLCCHVPGGSGPHVVIDVRELDFEKCLVPLTEDQPPACTLLLHMDDGTICVSSSRSASSIASTPPSVDSSMQPSADGRPFSSLPAKLSWSDACMDIAKLLECFAKLKVAQERQQACRARAAAAVHLLTIGDGARAAEIASLQRRLDALRRDRFDAHRKMEDVAFRCNEARDALTRRRNELETSQTRVVTLQSELSVAATSLGAPGGDRYRLGLELQGLCHLRWLAVRDISRIYPVSVHGAGAAPHGGMSQKTWAAIASGSKSGVALAIAGVPLVTGMARSGVIGPQDAAVRECSAAALGHVAAAVNLIERVLRVPLRYGLIAAGSRSHVCDRVAMELMQTASASDDQNSGTLTALLPLFTTGAADRDRHSLAIVLLHRNLEQMLCAFGPDMPSAYPVNGHRSSLLISLASLYAPAYPEVDTRDANAT